MSDSLRLHEKQHARPPCPSPTLRVYLNPCPSVGDAIQPSHPLSPPSPTFNLSQHRGLFQWVSSSHQMAKYWSVSFSISPSNEYLSLISFKTDCFDLLAVQGTFNNPLQNHSLKASILRSLAFFMGQLSHPYMTTGKIIALTIHTFVGKLMSLLFNTLSRFLIAILPRSKRLLISRLQSPSAMILEPEKMKSVTVFTCSPSICCEVMGPDASILVFWMLNFKPAFTLSSFTFNKRLFSSSSHSAFKVVSSAYLRLFMFLPTISFYQLSNHS